MSQPRRAPPCETRSATGLTFRRARAASTPLRAPLRAPTRTVRLQRRGRRHGRGTGRLVRPLLSRRHQRKQAADRTGPRAGDGDGEGRRARREPAHAHARAGARQDTARVRQPPRGAIPRGVGEFGAANAEPISSRHSPTPVRGARTRAGGASQRAVDTRPRAHARSVTGCGRTALARPAPERDRPPAPAALTPPPLDDGKS